MNQEKLMKRRMIRAIILFAITFIALLVSIALYIDETQRVQETYRRQYHTNLNKVCEDIESYQKGDGDFDLRYMRIVSDMSAANSFAFLLNMQEEHKITVNEITTCFMKYPEQMKGKLEEVDEALKDMDAELDKGYEKASEIVDSIYKKGH